MLTIHLHRPQPQPAWLVPALDGLMQPVIDRARESRSWWNPWQDRAAEQMVRHHHAIGGRLAVAKGAYSTRARRLDIRCRALLDSTEIDAIIEVGCGLSTRADRLASSLPWFVLDDVPLFRCWSTYFQESERWRFIPTLLPQHHWLRYLRRRCQRPLLVMESHGVAPAPTLARTWSEALAEHFTGGAVVSDVIADEGLREPVGVVQAAPRRLQTNWRKSSALLGRRYSV
jgi:O-methyltransferase involved in polyketide biosynthesis